VYKIKPKTVRKKIVGKREVLKRLQKAVSVGAVVLLSSLYQGSLNILAEFTALYELHCVV